ncbi:MAG TPA: AbrB/MazE/SpoVT family DNA-binding domain-containing protein [Chloroflexota bacterium]|nr:AbrB/MazE/SpoVT family DNA-binding domain-containing protein [Chloroflexota bacterium]
MLAKLTSKGQITVPRAVREKLQVKPGDALDFSFSGDRVEIRPVKRTSILAFRGLFAMTETLPFEQERSQAWGARTREIIAQRRGQ